METVIWERCAHETKDGYLWLLTDHYEEVSEQASSWLNHFLKVIHVRIVKFLKKSQCCYNCLL